MKYKNKLMFFLIFPLVSSCANKSVMNSGNDPSKKISASQYNMQLGLEYLNRNNLERAKYKLILAIQQDPTSVDAKLAMAYFWEKTGNNDLAEKEYKNALLGGSKELGAAHNNYGVFLCKINRYKEADYHFNKAIKDTSYTKTAEVLENAGICAMQSGKTAEAKIYFSKAVQYDSNQVTSLFYLVKIALANNRCSEASKWFGFYEDSHEHDADIVKLGKDVKQCFNVVDKTITKQSP